MIEQDDWEPDEYERVVWEHVDDEERTRDADEEQVLLLQELAGPSCDVFALDAEMREDLLERLLTEEESQDPDGDGTTAPTRSFSKGDVYENVCWGPHHANLSSKTHQRCQSRCGWLICSCGNCWCNMPAHKQATRRVRWEFVDGAVECPRCHGLPTRIRTGKVYRCLTCNGKGYIQPS